MSEDRDLERFAERVDRAFRAARPRPGFADELLGRVRSQPRRRAWLRPEWAGLGAAAAVLVAVAGIGYGLTQGGHREAQLSSGAGGSAAQGGPAQARSQYAGTFGVLPRPERVHAESLPAQSDGQPPAAPTLPAAAPVLRYAEPTAADADAFAAAHGARLTSSSPAARVYEADGFVLAVRPTSAATGVPASFVITPRGARPGGAGPPAPITAEDAQAAARSFLLRTGLLPPEAGRLETQASPGQPPTVRFVSQVGGADVVTAAGAPFGLSVTLGADGAVAQAGGPLPVRTETAGYPLAPFDALARQAGPGFTTATFVYALAFDGAYGYLEPAVLFSGPGRTALVPAVAAGLLR